MTAQAKNFENGARNAESTVIELNRIVAQAEELLKTLGEEGGAAVEAVRQRVLRTMSQAKVKLADAGTRARGAANDAAEATDRLRAHQSVEVDRLWSSRRCGRCAHRRGTGSPRLVARGTRRPALPVRRRPQSSLTRETACTQPSH